MNLSKPLQFPSPWPPPDLVSGLPESTLERIPIVGWLFGSWRRRRRWWVHVREVLIPIERQIVGQLTARSGIGYRADSPSHQRIADLITSVVAAEKGLSHVVLHPDDPIELLFWGPYDDMSPLLFRHVLRKELGIVLSTQEMQWLLRKGVTVSEVVAFCSMKTGEAPTGAPYGNAGPLGDTLGSQQTSNSESRGGGPAHRGNGAADSPSAHAS
ncbi:hypothetical protein [Thermostilla marina]